MLNPPAFADCGLPHGADVAVATTDDGHVGRTPSGFDDGSWGEHDQAARDDFEFRAPHVVSRAAKACCWPSTTRRTSTASSPARPP